MNEQLTYSSTSNTRFTVRKGLYVFVLSITVYSFFAAIFFLLDRQFSDAFRLAVLHLGIALSLYLVWRNGCWGRARFDSFGAALLLFGIGYKLQAMIDVLAYGTRVESLPLTVTFPADLMTVFFKAESIAVLGIVTVAIVWRIRIGSKVELFSFLNYSSSINRKMAWLVYFVALSVGLLKRGLGVGFGPFEQIMSILYFFGVISIFFICAVNSGRLQRFSSAAILASPLVVVALASGMKEAIFLPLVPAFVLYWFDFREAYFRAPAILIGIFILSISQLYVQHVRYINWYVEERLSTYDLVISFSEQLSQMEFSSALASISSRINMTNAHVTTVTLADSNGFEPREIFGGIPASFIPRVFWENKPSQQPGTVHTARILGSNVPLSMIHSSTAAGFLTEMYLGGGYAGLLIFAAIFGLLVASLQLSVFKFSPEFGHLAFAFSLAYQAMRFDESHVAYAFTGVVFTFVLLFVITQGGKLFQPKHIYSRNSGRVSHVIQRK